MANQKIRLGIIGAGKITTNKGRHIDSIRELGDPDVELVALADVLPGFARSVADKFGVPVGLDDYRQMLAMDDLDAVAINTPNDSHKDIAIEALRAGKHVYLEKPITNTLKEAEEVVAAAKESGKVFLAGSNGLLQKQMTTFKEMIDSGMMGEVYMVTLDRTSSRASDYGVDVRPKIGDGISVHSGSHNVEWALYFLGDPKPVSVTARGYFKSNNLSTPWQGRDEDDDGCIAMVIFDNGSSFQYRALRGAPVRDTYNMQIFGDKMSLEYDVHACYKEKRDDCITFYRHDKITGMEISRPVYKCERTHMAMYRHFFKCIRENNLEVSKCARGLMTMRILDAMVESIGLGGKQVLL